MNGGTVVGAAHVAADGHEEPLHVGALLSGPAEADGVTWLAQLWPSSGDAAVYARFAARVGDPNHPLARNARAYADGASSSED